MAGEGARHTSWLLLPWTRRSWDPLDLRLLFVKLRFNNYLPSAANKELRSSRSFATISMKIWAQFTHLMIFILAGLIICLLRRQRHFNQLILILEDVWMYRILFICEGDNTLFPRAAPWRIFINAAIFFNLLTDLELLCFSTDFGIWKIDFW